MQMSKPSKTESKHVDLRLLKRGRRGLLRAVFSRAGFILLFLLLQLALLALAFGFLHDSLSHYYTLNTVFSLLMALFLLNSRHDPCAKLSWIVLVMALPAFGALLYLYTRSDLGHRLLKRRFAQLSRETRDALPQDAAALKRFRRQAPEALGLCRYLRRTGCHPLYDQSSARYFSEGEALLPVLLHELEAAERFIFLEFFVVAEGKLWDQVLEVLVRKAAEGVDVRLIYDGTNEFLTLPRDYPKRLERLGIRCKVFAPVTPFVSTAYNYRDHRKILVIDGHTALTGGINLADEYINAVPRFGHWKDCALLLRGDAAASFTLMFLQMWNLDEKPPAFPPEYLSAAGTADENGDGFFLPYADCPLDEERVGEWVYMDLLNRARDYIYIMSPYLVLDGEMETALKFAAERGVDVRLILPGVPDKLLPYALAKTHYASLLRSGVKLYEYSPGFVHAKLFLCDSREAVVGTINLDYRSLYHHFECAVYLHSAACLPELRLDFLSTQALCRAVSLESLRDERLSVKLLGALLKVIAPLL